ncbi:MAG TPA: hypothetical protein VLC48_05910 [Gemmatimonadota bacterium]|nr:hypothetical protein [Gemmatimonadota bacterium]
MKRVTSGIAAVIAMLCWTSLANGQEMTERYIPIGQSPGISGEYSYIGQLQSVDAQNRTITVEDAGVTRIIKVTEKTRIWLDRSKQRMTNIVGSMDDLRTGVRVEVMYVDYAKKEAANWIKVEVAGSG